MKISKKRLAFLIIAVLLACFALAPVYSCGGGSDGDGGNNNNNPADNPGGQTDAEIGNGDSSPDSPAVQEYVYPEDMNGNGAAFKIAAPTTTWFFYTDIVHDEITGEILDDAIYTRNRLIEDKFNINFKETQIEIENFNNQVRKVTAAGDAAYDAAFCPMYRGTGIINMISENIFYNLREIPTMNLEEKWWNQMINKEATLGKGDRLFFAASDINIMTLQCVEAVFFNFEMMVNLGLELPYNKVKEGKWTFDAFNKYQKEGAQLNGAESFKWDKSSNAVYGLISYDNTSNALLDGSGERYVVPDSDGIPRLAIEGERFINVLKKIEDMLVVTDGSYLFANTMPDFHYEPLFRNGRSLMTMGELKAADVFREMDTAFGILPIPKYDENQENYYCHHIFATPMTVIPSTNPNPDFAGAVIDAMAYVSNKDVTPVFFDVTVSQKRLRDDESIDMLQIIKSSSCIDIGLVYGITGQYYEAIRFSLGTGKTFDIVSQTDKLRDKMNANIDKIIDLFE